MDDLLFYGGNLSSALEAQTEKMRRAVEAEPDPALDMAAPRLATQPARNATGDPAAAAALVPVLEELARAPLPAHRLSESWRVAAGRTAVQ
jgi:hypothetical protein